MTATDIFTKAALDILEHLGVDAIYTPIDETMDSKTIRVLISSVFNGQPSGMSSATWAQQSTIDFLISDLDQLPRIGDTIDDGVNTYTIEQQTENNGLVVKCICTVALND
jgi:hypothetical protein